MRLTSNLIKLALLLAVTVMTLTVVLFDADKAAQDGITHMAALVLGGLLHSLGGTDDT